MIFPIAALFYWNYGLLEFLSCTIVLLEYWFGWFLLYHHYFIAIWVGRLLLLGHCLIDIIIWLISSIAALFYFNYHSIAFFYSTTVFLRLRFSWLYLTSITPPFYCNYDLADLFSCTTILLELWLGFFLLFHDCLTGIINWLILFDCYYTTVLYQLWFAWSLLLHDCFIAIMIWLISFILAPFNCIDYLANFFCSTTVFLAIMS